MRSNKRYIIGFLALLLAGTIAWGQSDSLGYRIHSAYMIGAGGSITRDAYLSPLRYGGWTLNLLGEKTYPTRTPDSRWIIRTAHELDGAVMDNPANNAHFYSLLYNGAATALHRLPKSDDRQAAWLQPFRFAFGGGMELGVGGIYSTRNGNNPATLKLYSNIIAQGVVGYAIPSNSFPVYLRMVSQINLLGVAYGNGFGESYYENFILSNGIAGSLHLTHPGKLTRFTTLLSADFPVRNFCTIRVGYRYSHLGSTLNSLDTRINNHTVLVGFVTELYRFRGHKTMRTGRKTSLYYHD